jgi:CII-binding regulator of phage lambda lysogenization HflD
MRSYLVIIIGFSLLKTISLSAEAGAGNQSLYSLNYSNTSINTALEKLTQRIEAAHQQLEKYAPRCYITLATLSCIMIPTIIFLIKIIKIKTDTKLVLRPSAVMQEPAT